MNTREQGFSAMFWAVRWGLEEMTELLIKHGAKIDVLDNEGKDLFAVAHKHNHTRIIEILEREKEQAVVRATEAKRQAFQKVRRNLAKKVAPVPVFSNENEKGGR